MEKLMEGGRKCNLSLTILKEIYFIFLLQLPINFSYTIDARFVKHSFMIHLSVVIMAFYIESNYGFWIHKNSFFFVILHKNTIICF